MNPKLLEPVKEALEGFAAARPYDKAEIEVCMQVLATQIAALMETNADKLGNLSDAINLLEINKGVKKTLCELLSELQDAIDASSYDGGEDDDKDDTITDLITDFYYVLSPELVKIEAPE